MHIYRERALPAPTRVVTLWFKLVVGFLASALVFVPAIFVTIYSTVTPDGVAVWQLFGARFFALGIAWILSIVATASCEQEHFWECFVDAFSIPGLVFGFALIFQVPK